MRPFFPYYGSTWNRARYLPPPAHSVVYEPFAGGAGYSLFYNVPTAHLIDADPIVAGLWSWLIQASEADILCLPLLPEVGDNVDNYDIPREAKWLIGFWLNRGSATPKKSRTAYSARTDKGQLNWGVAARARVASQLGRIRSWTVVHGPYTQAPDVDATWLVDPPYVDKGRFYRQRFHDHQALGEWAKGRRGRVIVLEGPGADWLPFTDLGEFKTSKGKSREYVWSRL